MNVDKLLVGAGAYFGGDGVNYDRFEPHKFAALVLANTPQQRTWVGLTQEDIGELWANSGNVVGYGGLTFENIRAVEAKLKEKNT